MRGEYDGGYVLVLCGAGLRPTQTIIYCTVTVRALVCTLVPLAAVTVTV